MRPTFSQIRSLGDPALNNAWYIQFTKIPAAAGVTTEDLNFRCESSDIPKMSGQSVQVQIRGLPPVKYPGTYVPDGTFTLNFTETEDNKVTAAIAALRQLCYDSETGAGLPKAELEIEARLVRLSRQNKPIWEYNLLGVFIESYDPGGQLQGAQADILKPSMTLSYDSFTEKAL
jgi:hypothetical protein|nr:MAG TPA: Baseplate wedge protein [Bacteriophage sp.]DAT04524.1 MAG TPA: Baseplate wedge protein [Bacteriophage sp.]DAT11776.1 MAG TPA: Baseplate wedge protein [Herelleviridae sp.]